MRLRAGSLAYRSLVTLLALVAAAALICLQTACGGASSGSHIITQPPPPPPAGSVPITFFAVNDTTPTDPPQQYGLNYGTLGHPVPLAWQTIEANSGSFDFSQFDGFAENVAPKDANGTALMVMTLGMTPPWATSDPSTCRTGSGTTGCTAPPTNISDWANFITALIQHYNGVNAPHIKYYEIWNEADPDSEYWTGTAQQLEQLAQVAYPIIKQDPYSQVVTPSMAGNIYSTGPFATIPFLTAFLQAGGNPFPYADAMSFHGFVYNLSYVPYPLPTAPCSGSDSNCGGPIMAQVQTYRSLMDSFGMSNMPLLNTEGGFEDATISDTDTAAAWLAQYYALQAAMYNNYDIAVVSWFTWGASDGQLENDNVLTEVGTAYNQVSNWVVDRNLASPCSASGTVWTCTMTGSNGYQGEIIWDSSQTCSNGLCTTSTQSVASTYTTYLDLSGNSTPITGGTVQVGLKPILLQN